MLFARESRAALVTLKGLLSGVCHVVFAKVAARLECLLADPASVDAARVDLGVHSENLQALKVLFAAMAAVALIGTAAGNMCL